MRRRLVLGVLLAAGSLSVAAAGLQPPQQGAMVVHMCGIDGRPCRSL